MMDAVRSSPVFAFLAALCVTLVATPLVHRIAWRFDALAHPDSRRLHAQPTALWGGLAIFLGVLAAALIWRQPTWQDLRLLAPSNALSDIVEAQKLHLSTTFLTCGLLMLLLGMLDDRFEFSAVWKFAGQLAIVYLLWQGGVRIHTLPLTAGTQPLSDLASFGLTAFWVLGLTNAVNLIDGLDGLASGICAISAGCLCLIEILKGATWAASASAAVCGASVGFLRYNFHPARIYLGDAGSLLLGFWLAAIAIAAASKTAAATTLILPMMLLGVPLFDTGWAIVRRTWARRPWWKADRGHLHHRLLDSGLSTVHTVIVLYSISAVLGLVAVLWVRLAG
jgi:UDP-GlcNAc:undecaprenyl-phosphate GlcNAc-1-phosphate transferase